jgi:hypothetical protein
MKPLYLLLISLLLLKDAGAQTKAANARMPSKGYDIVSAGFGEFYPRDPGHDISATFPYMVKDVSTGSVTQQTFSGALHGKFTKPSYLIDLLNLEIVRKHHGSDVGFGLLQEAGGDHGFFLKGGYRYILQLGGLLIKPSIDLYYLNGVDRMGRIDNKEKEISLFGFTASEQYTTESSDDDGVSMTSTHTADHLDVNYRRYSVLVEPKIILANKPRGAFAISLEGGWMLPVSQMSILQFEQRDGSAEGNKVGSISFGKNGFLSGPYVAINVGYVFNRRGRRT